jgi:aminoglycoside phosphotransferase (APT) family kinase protein
MITEPSTPRPPQVSTLPSLKLVARGMVSELYDWPQNRLLKLLHARFPREVAEREFEITRALHAAGVPVPAVYELQEIDGRFGFVIERIDGISLLQLAERRPWKLFYVARLLADLHAALHQHTAPPPLPTQRSQLERWLADARDFTPAERKAAETSLAQLPDGDTLCHGDFHPANILLSNRGPVIIDWSTGTRGHSFSDVARTSILFESAPLPPQSPWYMHLLLALSRRLLYRTYLRRYLRLRKASIEEVSRFLPAQRAARAAFLQLNRPSADA